MVECDLSMVKVASSILASSIFFLLFCSRKHRAWPSQSNPHGQKVTFLLARRESFIHPIPLCSTTQPHRTHTHTPTHAHTLSHMLRLQYFCHATTRNGLFSFFLLPLLLTPNKMLKIPNELIQHTPPFGLTNGQSEASACCCGTSSLKPTSPRARSHSRESFATLPHTKRGTELLKKYHPDSVW